MKRITVDEEKEILVGILDEIHNICTKNNIHYSLAYGSLLGAVRHKGFIPWDDDIDICMLRKDYDRFCSVFNKECSSGFRLLSIEDTNYIMPVSKVIDTRTELIEELTPKMVLGVYVDVFVVDYIPEAHFTVWFLLQKIKTLRNIYNLKTITVNPDRAIWKNVMLSFSKFILKPLSLRNIVLRIDELARSYDGDSTPPYCGALTLLAYGKREIMKTEWFNSYILMSFEGKEYYISAFYDNILRNLYGEYMIPPPPDKQISHHVFEAYYK